MEVDFANMSNKELETLREEVEYVLFKRKEIKKDELSEKLKSLIKEIHLNGFEIIFASGFDYVTIDDEANLMLN